MRSELSFSGKVKEELCRHVSEAQHCRIAELSAIISMCGRVRIDCNDKFSIKIRTDNLSIARKCFTLLEKTFNICNDVLLSENRSSGSEFYSVNIKRHEDAIRVLQVTKLMDEKGEIEEEILVTRNIIMQQSCCKRAFLRGAFLVGGSISNPEKSYHLEIVCAAETKAEQIKNIIDSFGLEAKIITRKKTHVVYLKEGSQIVDLLGIMEASVGLMDFENVRILKEMRNSVNRKVNCETANINKTVSAAVKQALDIKYIQERMGLHNLSEGLEEIAELRLQYPEASLKELGEYLSEPVGKSGVNHRLRKLSEIAERLREQEE